MKWKPFEKVFVLIQANTACRQQMKFSYFINYCCFSTPLLITTNQALLNKNQKELSIDSVWYLMMEIHYGFFAERDFIRDLGKLNPTTWLFWRSWFKVIKALRMYQILNRECQGLCKRNIKISIWLASNYTHTERVFSNYCKKLQNF